MAPLSLTYTSSEGDENGDYLTGGPSTSGILLVILVFSCFALLFTIVTGWRWCVSTVEPTYNSVKVHRKGSWRTKRVVPFKEWYRRKLNLPRTQSDLLREADYARVLMDLRANGWEGRVLRNGKPDDRRWIRPHNTNFWRLHGHRNSLHTFRPLMRKVEGYGSVGIPAKKEEGWVDTDEAVGSVPFSPFTIPQFFRPPLRVFPGNGNGGGGCGGGKRQRSRSLGTGNGRLKASRTSMEDARSNNWGPKGSRIGRCDRAGSGLSPMGTLGVVMEEGGQGC